jgi:hypothetical protein
MYNIDYFKEMKKRFSEGQMLAIPGVCGRTVLLSVPDGKKDLQCVKVNVVLNERLNLMLPLGELDIEGVAADCKRRDKDFITVFMELIISIVNESIM